MTEWLGPMFDNDIIVWIEPAQSNDEVELTFEWAQLLASNGVLTAHELRKLAPFTLPEETAFDRTLVGGQNMETTNPIEKGIRSIISNELGSRSARRTMELLGYGSNNAQRRNLRQCANPRPVTAPLLCCRCNGKGATGLWQLCPACRNALTGLQARRECRRQGRLLHPLQVRVRFRPPLCSRCQRRFSTQRPKPAG